MGITNNNGYRSFAVTTGFIAIFSGILVIIGWIGSYKRLTHLAPHYLSMKFNTAVCLILAGLALVISLAPGLKRLSKGTTLFASASFVIALVSLLEHISGFDIGIDRLLHSAPETVATPHPEGRITPVTSVCICFVSAGIFFAGRPRLAYYSQYLLHFVTIITFTIILGYVFGVKELHSYSFATSMALHSAINLFLLSVAVALVNPALGFAGLFTGNLIGNLMARQLFIRIVCTMIAATYIRIIFHRYHLMTPEIAAVFFPLLILGVILVLIRNTSNALNKIEADRKQAEERFQLVVESVPNALLMSDSDGTIILANKQAKIMFGYTEEELLGKKIEVLVPKSIRDHHPEIRKSYYRGPRQRTFSTLHNISATRRNGQEFPVEIGLMPIKTETGIVALSSVTDITERKRHENIIRKQMKELKIKNAEMERFTYIASHDLQEPLRTVTNYLELLQEDYPELMTEEVSQHIAVMNAAVGRMSILVRSLLDYGRLGQNKILSETN